MSIVSPYENGVMFGFVFGHIFTLVFVIAGAVLVSI